MRPERGIPPPIRLFAEHALSRVAGAALVPGNRARILRDSTENYPAWLAAIRGARSVIHFENYIVADDPIGREFAEALAERARSGVRVRIIYDWMGGFGYGSKRVLATVARAGGEVRCFNPPRFESPFGWLTRDHRKMLAVDGEVGFVSGLCVSERWSGDPARRRDPWRDTGVEIRGPAVADIDRAFAEAWAEVGEPIPPEDMPAPESEPAGDVALRVIATVPSLAAVYRVDQLIASVARESLWLTDAYFVGVPPYVQALRAAAADGVDVRLLVPGTSDLPVVSSFSRSGYRPLLEAGVRVFEWNGPMLHAKTAVADGRWARIGSSNLNIASWIGNYELDVAVEDRGFAESMENLYEEDLANSTEIVLAGHRRVRSTRPLRRGRRRAPPGRSGGSAGRTAASALRIGNTVSAVITSRRILGPAESGLTIGMGAVLIALSLIGVLWPRLLVVPLALFGTWLGVSFLIKGVRLRSAQAVAQGAGARTGQDGPESK